MRRFFQQATAIGIATLAVLALAYFRGPNQQVLPAVGSPASARESTPPSVGWTGRSGDSLPRRATAPPIDATELADALLAQGHTALADGDMEAGLQAFRRAVEFDPSASTHAALGRLYLRAAATNDAVFHLRRSAELDPQNPDRWIDLANAYFLKQELGEGWRAVDTAKAVEPGIEIERDENNFLVRANRG